MAWPLTPLTTYVAGLAPAIKAFDLNSLQNAINRIVGATYSLAALVVDGTGGAVVVPVPGTTKVSANLTETTLPGTARSKGTDCIGTRLWGWVNFDGSGVVMRHFNSSSAAGIRTGMGSYTVEFYGAPADPDFCLVSGTVIVAGACRSVQVKPYLSGGGNLALDIRIYDETGALVDAAASVGVWAE